MTILAKPFQQCLVCDACSITVSGDNDDGGGGDDDDDVRMVLSLEDLSESGLPLFVPLQGAEKRVETQIRSPAFSL